MKKVQTFTTKHLYYLLSAGLLLTLIATVPLLMRADVTDTGPSCPSYDRDCDGFPNRVPPGCNVCSAFDVDMDDTDPNIPSAVGPFL